MPAQAMPARPLRAHPIALSELAARAGLPATALQQLQQVLAQEPRVQHAVLYGSRAMGHYRPGSDIDICLTAPALDLSSQYTLENRIDDLLLPWKVDLSLRHAIDNPDLLAHIARVGLSVYPPAQP